MSSTKIRIDVERNTLICGENGGNAWVSPGGRIKWRATGKTRFTLEFFRLGIESDAKPMDVSALDHWPFEEPPPPRGGIVGPTDEFKGTLKDEKSIAYKYCVTVGNLRLDPIIIVDR